MASAPAMGRTAAVLAASGSFAAAGLLAQYHKGDASLMPVAAALALADPGAGGSWAARALAVAHGVAGGVAQAVCPRVALAAALVVPDAVHPDVATLLTARHWPLEPRQAFYIALKHEGIQLLMNVNGYFAHVAALDDEAAAQGQALAEWPPFWVPHVQRALLWGVANLTARELVIKCLKYKAETYLSYRLATGTAMSMLIPVPAQIANAAAALGPPSRDPRRAWLLANAAASACAATSWLFSAADAVVSVVADGMAECWQSWGAGTLNADAGAQSAWRAVARFAPLLFPLVTAGGTLPPILVACVGAAALNAGLAAALPPAAYARWVRGARVTLLRCSASLACGCVGSGAVALVSPAAAANAYLVCDLASWHVLVAPAVAGPPGGPLPAGAAPPWVLAGLLAAGAVALLHVVGGGAALR